MEKLIVKGPFEYRLKKDTIEQTGNGYVCCAQDSTYQREVFVKCIEVTENVEDEAKAMIAASKVTKHIPTVFHYFFNEDKTKFYIIMELIRGVTLDKKFTVSQRDFLDYMEKVCDILARIQKQNLIHKDIKTKNIMITPENDVYLLDFGISMGAPNLIEGTPGYKAPETEIGSNNASREKVDMFALGVIMYNYFTKLFPRGGREYSEGSFIQNSDETSWYKFTNPSELNKTLNPEIDALIKKCMERSPEKRFKNYRELKTAIRNAKKGNRYWKKNTKK